MNKSHLILVTNDDGIQSRGLWAAVEALIPLGHVVVVAPDRQWSGAGRAVPVDVSGEVTNCSRMVGGRQVPAFAVDASPALCVVHAMTELLPRRPSVVVSGINYGANMSIEVTASGTVGAALEAAAFGLPAMAVSQEMAPDRYLEGDENEAFGAAMRYTEHFADQLLSGAMPYDVHVLNLNAPMGAGPNCGWRSTRLSRHRYSEPTAPNRENGQGRPSYCRIRHPEMTEHDSDIRTVMCDRLVSMTPLSLDLTSRGMAANPLWQMSVSAIEGIYAGTTVA